MSTQETPDGINVLNMADQPELTGEIDMLIVQFADQPADVVVDFSGVRFVSSTTLATLLSLRKQIADMDRRLALCAIDEQIWSVFQTTHLDSMFEVAPDVEAARALLKAPPAPAAKAPRKKVRRDVHPLCRRVSLDMVFLLSAKVRVL